MLGATEENVTLLLRKMVEQRCYFCLSEYMRTTREVLAFNFPVDFIKEIKNDLSHNVEIHKS